MKVSKTLQYKADSIKNRCANLNLNVIKPVSTLSYLFARIGCRAFENDFAYVPWVKHCYRVRGKRGEAK